MHCLQVLSLKRNNFEKYDERFLLFKDEHHIPNIGKVTTINIF